MPGISSSGNSSPQSTARTSSPDSSSIMLRPISPSPPSGIRRTAGSAGVSMGCGSDRYAVLTSADVSYHPPPERQKRRLGGGLGRGREPPAPAPSRRQPAEQRQRDAQGHRRPPLDGPLVTDPALHREVVDDHL